MRRQARRSSLIILRRSFLHWALHAGRPQTGREFEADIAKRFAHPCSMDQGTDPFFWGKSRARGRSSVPLTGAEMSGIHERRFVAGLPQAG
jgi:hypothetical protein